MIKKWYSSIAADLAKMVDVTDEMILENSNGVVNKVAPDEDQPEDPKAFDNTLEDVNIFGQFGEEHLDLMGHIECPIPVVNVQYTKGRCPGGLQKALGMNNKEIDLLLHCAMAVRQEDDWAKEVKMYRFVDYEKGQIEGTFLTCGAAIEALLKYKGIDSSKYILHNLPVMPICMRYVKCKEGTEATGAPAYMSNALNTLYARVVLRANRVRVLQGLDAPKIIMMNECRMFQEYVDELINNGVPGAVVAKYNGIPKSSLDDLYDQITKVVYPDRKASDEYVEALSTICRTNEVKEKWDKCFNLAFREEEDENGETFLSSNNMTDEEVKEYDKYSDALMAYLTPFIKTLHERYFLQYEYDGVIPEIVKECIRDALTYWKPDRETAAERLVYPVICAFDLYYRKQYMWIEKKKTEEAAE